jgi:hypothetical protein
LTTDTVDQEFIYRASITLRNGKRIFASHYGLTAFRIRVRRPPPKRD